MVKLKQIEFLECYTTLDRVAGQTKAEEKLPDGRTVPKNPASFKFKYGLTLNIKNLTAKIEAINEVVKGFVDPIAKEVELINVKYCGDTQGRAPYIKDNQMWSISFPSIANFPIFKVIGSASQKAYMAELNAHFENPDVKAVFDKIRTELNTEEEYDIYTISTSEGPDWLDVNDQVNLLPLFADK